MRLLGPLLAVGGLHVISALAQGTVLREQIWGTVIFTRYGDRTPYILPETPTLTPLGAQQLFNVGSTFRNRYVTPPTSAFNVNTAISGISEFQLNNDQVTLESTSDQFIAASAQAFMQGLYPPLQDSSNYTFIDSLSTLANGTTVQSPLNGYQYPQLYVASKDDLNLIWVAGEVGCITYTSSRSDYFLSSGYEAVRASTADFYAGLQPLILDGVFSNASVGYFDAYYIWDYISYGNTHNTSVANHISEEDLLQARTLADEWVFATNGNLTAYGVTPGDHIRAVAGRTLANRIVEAIYININTGGLLDKMTLLFGSFEPMVAFASLAGLPSEQNPQFYGVPDLGSSMVFELFSFSADEDDNYPDTSNLNVRFLFQNGTEDDAELISYPLFGRDPSQITMTLEEFLDGMESIMMGSVGDWCDMCKSDSVFCPDYEDAEGGDSSSGSSPGSQSSGHRGLEPAVAGVVGAIVTLVVIGLAVAAAMLLGGLRLYHTKTKRRSDLGGFKGAEKLASDQDLSLAKGGAGAAISSPAPARMHERVGSWELGDQNRAKESQLPNLTASDTPGRRPSFEDDDLHVSPFAEPVKPDDRV